MTMKLIFVTIFVVLVACAEVVNSQQKNVELFIVADYAFYKHWKDYLDPKEDVKKFAEYYFAHIVNGVRKIYEKIKDFKITVSLVGIHVVDNAADSNFTEHKSIKVKDREIDGNKALVEFGSWIEKKKAENKILPSKYDLAVLITGYFMGDFNGLAYPAEVCKNFGFSINRDTGMFQTIGTVAHEIGHNLGSNHDGINNTCNHFHQFVMSTGRRQDEYSSNSVLFSTCSLQSFKKHFDDLKAVNKDCLLDTPSTDISKSKEHMSTLPGQKWDLDEQCKMFYGDKNSYYCGGGGEREANLCHQMYCYDADYKTCQNRISLQPLDGTPCGSGKWCMDNKCVADSGAKKLDKEHCRNGDYRDIVPGEDKKCGALINSSPRSCYNEYIAGICCESCAKAKKSDSNCPYGDRHHDCRVRDCRKENVNYLCCETCKNVDVPKKTAGCKDKGDCRRVMSWQCYDPKTASDCCETCHKLQLYSSGDCKYGNVASWCKEEVAGAKQNCKKTEFKIDKLCCDSCKGN